MSTHLDIRTSQLSIRLPGERVSRDARKATHILNQLFTLLDGLTQDIAGDARRFNWEFAELGLGSVAAVIQAPAIDDVALMEAATSGLQSLVEGLALAEGRPIIPPGWDDVAVHKARTLARLLPEEGLELQMLEERAGEVSLITRRCADNLGMALRDKIETIGSLTGTLEKLDVHNKRKAKLWLEAPRRVVDVLFGENDYERVHSALRKRVQVSGLITWNHRRVPKVLRLRGLRVIEPKAETLESFSGSVPGLTEGLGTDEYVRRLYDAS